MPEVNKPSLSIDVSDATLQDGLGLTAPLTGPSTCSTAPPTAPSLVGSCPAPNLMPCRAPTSVTWKKHIWKAEQDAHAGATGRGDDGRGRQDALECRRHSRWSAAQASSAASDGTTT